VCSLRTSVRVVFLCRLDHLRSIPGFVAEYDA